MSHAESVLAVVGGGRWGKVTLSVLADMKLPFDRIVVISQTSSNDLQSKIDVLPTINDALDKYNIKAAVVVNATRQHFHTANELIKRGIPVLVEKPIVQTLEQMHTLIAEALQHNVCLVPGLCFRFCAYLKNFSNELFDRGIPKQFSFKWVDSPNEIRYGQTKKHDQSISVVEDVMPHIFTILSLVFRSQQISVNKCIAQNDNGSYAVFNAEVKTIPGEILLDRNGDERQRYLSVQLDTGTLILDFSTEPGIIFAGDKKFSADLDWGKKPSPLTLQLEYFFSVIATGRPMDEDLQYCLDSVVCGEQAVRVMQSEGALCD